MSPKKLISNTTDAAQFSALVFIFALIPLVLLGYWAYVTHVSSQSKEQLQPTLKSMMAVSVASRANVSRDEFREKVLTAKTEFNSLPTEKISQAVPDAFKEIEQALLCWEAAEFLWQTEGEYGFGGKTPTAEMISRLMDYTKKGLGGDTYAKLEKASGTGIGIVLLDSTIRGQVIAAFVEVGEGHFQSARRLLD